MKKFNAQAFATYALLVVTVVLLGVTGYLVQLTKDLKVYTVSAIDISTETAADIKASCQTLSNVETGISNLVTGLTGVDSQLTKQLAGIKSDTAATKDALVDEIKDDIDDIRRDVGTIEGQVGDIKSLLTPPSD